MEKSCTKVIDMYGYELTSRERLILEFMTEGYENNEIADNFIHSIRTFGIYLCACGLEKTCREKISFSRNLGMRLRQAEQPHSIHGLIVRKPVFVNADTAFQKSF